jgi:transcriptional regulator with XRE-family HTH domain
MEIKETMIYKNKFGHFSDILTKLMKHHNHSSTYVAKHLDLTANSIIRLMNNENVPKLSTVQKLANFFGISVAQLIGEAHLNLRTNEADKFSISLITDHSYFQVVHIDNQSINDAPESYTADQKMDDIICAYRVTSSHYGHLFGLHSIVLIAPYIEPNGLLLIDELGYLSIKEAVKDGPIVKLKSLITERLTPIEDVSIVGAIRQVILPR